MNYNRKNKFKAFKHYPEQILYILLCPEHDIFCLFLNLTAEETSRSDSKLQY